MSINIKKTGPILIIILLCYLSRLPQLLSPYLFLDGDECLVGTMAKHIYIGKELPLFFWGQQYGFSLIECLFILPFYAVLGINTLAIKLAMLSLWTTGVVMLYKVLRLFAGNNLWVPFLLTVLFIFLPAWAVWSMKARGGYLTAFVCSNLLIYLLYHPRLKKTIWKYIVMAILLSIIYEAQRFWFAGLMPLVLYRLYKEKDLLKAAALLVCTGLCFLLFFFYKQQLTNYYPEGIHLPSLHDAMQRLLRLPQYLYISFHGNYYFDMVHTAPFFCKLLSVFTSILVCLLFVAGVYHLLLKRKGNGLFICSALFLPLCFVFTLAFPEIHGRYLLPLTGFAIISLQVYISRFRSLKIISAAIVVWIVLATPAIISFYNYELLDDREKQVNNLLQYFEKNNVKYVYSLEPMVSWEIVFYSGETILARVPGCISRYTPYDTIVNKAFLSGQKTALIYRYWEGDAYHFPSVIRLGMYKIGLSPQYAELKNDFCMPE